MEPTTRTSPASTRGTPGPASTGCTGTPGTSARIRAEPGAQQVRWVHGDTGALAGPDPPVAVATARTEDLPGAGAVTTWVQVTDVGDPDPAGALVVSSTTTFALASDGQELVSRSVLRFRTRETVQADLLRGGLTVVDVRGAPDRPGLELVLVAARPARSGSTTGPSRQGSRSRTLPHHQRHGERWAAQRCAPAARPAAR